MYLSSLYIYLVGALWKNVQKHECAAGLLPEALCNLHVSYRGVMIYGWYHHDHPTYHFRMFQGS